MNLVKARSKSLIEASILALGLCLCGCKEGDTAPPAGAPPQQTADPAPPPAAPEAASQAQPKLRTIKLWLGSHEIIAEIAHSQKEIQTGMMHRTTIAETEGMLFVFDYPHRTAFYMKNTLVPLSCAYIDSDGIILETHDMFPKVETPIVAGSDKVRYVLEVKQGWFQRHNVGVGTLIRTEKGSLGQTFFGR